MSSRSTKLRTEWKEKEPEKYQAYLERQRLASKRRRDEKKEKFANEVLTRAMEEDREREKALRRERDRRYREKKAAEAGRRIQKRRQSQPAKTGAKHRCDMTPDEQRQHDAQVRTAYNHQLSHQKRTALRKKNRERMRAARQKARAPNEDVAVQETVGGVVNIIKKLPKTLLNVSSKVFYTNNEVARSLPHKRYTTKHGPAFVMIVTIKGAHRMFVNRHPQLSVGLTKFASLRPKNVRKMGSVEALTCLCLYCQNVKDLLAEMELDLKQPVRGTSFAEHLFTAYWQQNQYKYAINTLMPGEVLLIEDFAENRKATYAAEVKSAHFGKQQITLHPIVAYIKNDEYQLIRHSLMFISNDIGHDFHMVNKFTDMALAFLKEETEVESVIIYSDGCAGQYKGKGTFADLILMSGMRVQRAFFGSEHGKGEADGETGVLSQAMDRAVRSGTNISSARDLYQWATSTLSKAEGLHRRTFFYVPQEDINRNRPYTDIATVPGTRKMHQVVRLADYVIKSRSLACFCCACRADNASRCINKLHVGDFTTHQLKLNSISVNEAETAHDTSSAISPSEEPLQDGVIQIGKMRSAVRRLVESTQAVQALASIVKVDNKALVLKGLRTLSEFSALCCSAQFAAQVLAAKAEEKLVNHAEDDNTDIAYFSLCLIFRLCDQGLVRPSLGAAGLVTLLLRLMSSTQPHVNRVSVLNALCLCSKDSVNRNRMEDSGALTIFMSVLKGKEETLCHEEECKKLNQSRRKSKTLKSSQFNVLYDRIISTLVNYIYHNESFKRLLNLGLVDILVQHLERCCDLQSPAVTDIRVKINSLANNVKTKAQKSAQTQGNKNMLASIEKATSNLNESACDNDDGKSACDNDNDEGNDEVTIVTESMELNDAKDFHLSPNDECASGSLDTAKSEVVTERSRHVSSGLECVPDLAPKDADVGGSLLSDSMYQKLDVEVGTIEEEDEEKISQHILSRDPLNIDNQNADAPNQDAAETPSRKTKHVYSINSPTYQSEVSRRVEDCSFGATCKNFSHSHSHPHPLICGKETSLMNAISPLQGISSGCESPYPLSPAGYQSPYSPLSADASYYSPAQSSPAYSDAASSPSSFQSRQSPHSQPSHSPALSVLTSSLGSPARSLISSPTHLHTPPHHNLDAGSFSPLSNNVDSLSQFIGEADAETPEMNSQRTLFLTHSQSSPRFLSGTFSDVGGASCSSQTLPSSNYETTVFTQEVQIVSSPVYSSVDSDDDDNDEEEERENIDIVENGKQNKVSDSVNGDAEANFKIIKREEPAKKMLEKNISGYSQSQDVDEKSSISLSTQTQVLTKSKSVDSIWALKYSNKRPSSLSPDSSAERLFHDSCGKSWPSKRTKLNSSLPDSNSSSARTLQISLPSTEPTMSEEGLAFTATPHKNYENLNNSENMDSLSSDSVWKTHQTNAVMNAPNDGEIVVPRSSKVLKKFQKMISDPEPKTLAHSQKDFKRRASHSNSQTIDSNLTAYWSTELSLHADTSCRSPSDSLATKSTAAVNSQSCPSTRDVDMHRLTASSSFINQATESKRNTNSSVSKQGKGSTSNQKLKRTMRTTESNILILLSAISVKPETMAELVQEDFVRSLLHYIRASSAPLQRSCRILTRLFNNPLAFSKLLLYQAPALIVRFLILEDDGTFPAAMFCSEWKNQFGQVQRSRMNLSDFLSTQASDDSGGGSGSQASDFGRKLDFEFGSDAYSKAKSLGSGTHNTHRLFRHLFHSSGSLSIDSQDARDENVTFHPAEEIYRPGESRIEARVCTGLSFLRCFGALAMSSFGEGEIQHILQRGTLGDTLSLRISLLHMPIAWERMTRHHFSLKHQSTWDDILPILFMGNAPQEIREMILTVLSFNLHLDFPPKLALRILNMVSCPDTTKFKSSKEGGVSDLDKQLPPHLTQTLTATQQTHSSKTSPSKFGSPARGFSIQNSNCIRHQQLSSKNLSIPLIGSEAQALKDCEENTPESPSLFDEDEGEVNENNLQVKNLKHRKCPYWETVASHDIFFIINENSMTYKHGAVRAIMMRKSEVFSAMLGGAYVERLKQEIKLSDTKASSFECLIHYLHGCTCSTCSVLCCLTLNKSFTAQCNVANPVSEGKIVSLELVKDSPTIISSSAEIEEVEQTCSKVMRSGSGPHLGPESSRALSSDQTDCNHLLHNLSPQDKQAKGQRAFLGCSAASGQPSSAQSEQIHVFKALEELINTCSDVLALADRYLLTDLVTYITSALSHVCLYPHTWEDLFALACFYKLRPLAVDCMREALLAHVPVQDTAASLLDLEARGYKDQMIEALSLLLKSACIH
ncbi:Armadillo repeat-containing protein 5-like isoform x2 [Plakobranchus ocellatus]|uniref:Armadillo repeat-containing protein 5-like isoform x2 n=1 Tax=Plakobranchus ocellatus TaxID=259542 RepID=A0AAV4DR91_9GAST|nr:Armadillo repeat-containing protein 5-like isoform x2 [Plakobranchus ocellatus]